MIATFTARHWTATLTPFTSLNLIPRLLLEDGFLLLLEDGSRMQLE